MENETARDAFVRGENTSISFFWKWLRSWVLKSGYKFQTHQCQMIDMSL